MAETDLPLQVGMPCWFCGEPQTFSAVSPQSVCDGWIVQTSTPLPEARHAPFPDWREANWQGRYEAIVPLCDLHEQLIRRTGTRGRLHGPTRVRWWLSADCDDSNITAGV